MTSNEPMTAREVHIRSKRLPRASKAKRMAHQRAVAKLLKPIIDKAFEIIENKGLIKK